MALHAHSAAPAAPLLTAPPRGKSKTAGRQPYYAEEVGEAAGEAAVAEGVEDAQESIDAIAARLEEVERVTSMLSADFTASLQEKLRTLPPRSPSRELTRTRALGCSPTICASCAR